MGIMICPVHGRTEFVEMCSHVAHQVGAGSVPTGRRLDVLGHLMVCEACFHSLGFYKCEGLADATGPSFDNQDARWKIFDAAYQAIEDREGFCLKCVANLTSTELPE